MPAARSSAGGTGSPPTRWCPISTARRGWRRRRASTTSCSPAPTCRTTTCPRMSPTTSTRSAACAPRAWRGIGAGATNFAIEVVIDELAQLAGQNPLEYRLALLKDPRAKRVVETAAKMAEWSRKRDGTRARDLVRQARPAADRLLAGRDGRRDVGRSRQRQDPLPQSVVRGRRRPAGAARQRGGAARELADLRARQRAQGAHHDQERRGAADQLPRLRDHAAVGDRRRSRWRSSARATFRCRSASSACRAWCRRSPTRCSR